MKRFFLTATVAIVIPAQAGIQCPRPSPLDSRLRGNDGVARAGRPGFMGWGGVQR
ncbi:MAG: hypothetical protein JSR53_12505 [Proteobacteria bacterium]|nr:hypothetical protein [Pseudomonadota bacterium]